VAEWTPNLGRVTLNVITRRLSLTAAVSLSAIAAGCGGGSGAVPAETTTVKQTVLTALADLARGDGPAFCALATPAGRAKLARTLPGYSCAKLVAYIGGNLSPGAKQGLLHARVQRVTISGDNARVRSVDITATQGSLKGVLNDGGKPTTLIRQSDGSWKIDM
jgi:hypothetical protein